MKTLIACLGYDLLPDGSIPELLSNRLDDVIKLYREHKDATVLVMGAQTYRDASEVQTI